MTFASSHNGGRLQANFGSLLQTNGDYPFLNIAKTAQTWGPSNNVPVPPTLLDVNGYPSDLSTVGSLSTVFYAPAQSARPGNYVMTWSGNGTLSYSSAQSVLATASFTGVISSGVLTASAVTGNIYKGMSLTGTGITAFTIIVQDQLTGTPNGAGTYSLLNATDFSSRSMTVTGGSLTSSGGNGRYVFSTSAVRFQLAINSIGSPIVTNLVVCHVDDEALLAAGQVFGTKFKQRLLEAKFGVLRFIQWQSNTTSNVTSWRTRKPVGYIAYGSGEARLEIHAGATTNVGNAYTSGIPSIHASDGTAWVNGDAPKSGDLISVVFNAAASAAPCTLTVGSGGSTSAINILNEYSNSLASTAGYPVSTGVHAYATMMFDATLNAYIKREIYGIDNGVPVELMFQLCAEIGAHPYFNMPTYSSLTPTDFARSLAIYGRDNYQTTVTPWMVLISETPDESWNNSAFFYGAAYFNNMATAYGAGWNNNEVAGKAASLLGQDFSAIFSGDRTKYKVLAGVQTTTATTASNTSASIERINSTKFTTASPPAGYLADSARNWITHVCNAQYFDSGHDRTQLPSVWSYQWAMTGDTSNLPTFIDGCNPPNAGVTFTNGTPGKINWTAHGRSIGDPLNLITTGSLPTGLAGVTRFFVLTVPSPDQITVATSVGGAAINISGSATGTATALACLLNPSVPHLNVMNQNWKALIQSINTTNNVNIKLEGYEGGFSPDYGLGATTGVITAATKANPCVITIPTTNVLGFAVSNSVTSSYCAGMALTIASAAGMTELNTPAATGSLTFATDGSGNITGANSLQLNMAVSFSASHTTDFPAELALIPSVYSRLTSGYKSKYYYVVSAGNPFKISDTRGGAARTFSSAGTSVTAQGAWFISSVGADPTKITLDFDSSGAGTYTASSATATVLNGNWMIDAFRAASKQVTNTPNAANGLLDYVYTNLKNFVALSDGSFTAEFPSLYMFAQNNDATIGGAAWAVLEDIYQANTPGFDAHKLFSTRKRRIVVKT